MAHHKSALKRIRQTKRRNLYNRMNKDLVKKAVRDVKEATSYEDGMEKLNKAISILDKVTARGILHKNRAAHKKSKLSLFVKNLKA